MLTPTQRTALENRRAQGAISELEWQVAALLGLEDARAEIGGYFVPLQVREGGAESWLLADLLGLPAPVDGSVQLWLARVDSPAERVYAGPAEGIVPALRTQLADQVEAIDEEGEEMAFDMVGSTSRVDGDGFNAVCEAAEEEGVEPLVYVGHPQVPLWFALCFDCVAEGGPEVCEALSLPDDVRAAVLIAWVQTNNSGDPMQGLIVTRGER